MDPECGKVFKKYRNKTDQIDGIGRPFRPNVVQTLTIAAIHGELCLKKDTK
jgi:hypothetical protein